MPDFDLDRKLGNGAFGEVWLGNDRALGVQRAIKFVPSARVSDPTNFYSEPQTLVALKHENVIEITDAGTTADGKLYIAMEYYPDGSISDQTKGGIVPLEKALKLSTDICRGLEYAHALGYVHRDIKPANVIIDHHGNARLSDFGLATKVRPDGTAGPYGYFGHLAPEVITDDITDFQTDVYALGVTMYRLVNGDAYLPLTIDTDDLLEMIKEGTFPNRRSYRPFIPTALRTVINRAMDLNRTNRYSSPSELRHAFEKISIHTSWLPQTIPNGTKWTAKIGNMEYEAFSLRHGKGCFDFQLLKGRTGKSKRVVSSATQNCVKKSIHDRHVKSILTRIVSYGKL